MKSYREKSFSLNFGHLFDSRGCLKFRLGNLLFFMIPLWDFVPELNSRPGTTTGLSSRQSDSRLYMALNLRQKSSFTFNMLWSLSETQMLKRRLQCWNEDWIVEAISWVFKRQLQSWILFSVFELVWCWMQRNCFVPKSSYLNRKHNG